eukprot:scaffold15055_cov121-Isochrysis_galbana.AAC.6
MVRDEGDGKVRVREGKGDGRVRVREGKSDGRVRVREGEGEGRGEGEGGSGRWQGEGETPMVMASGGGRLRVTVTYRVKVKVGLCARGSRACSLLSVRCSPERKACSHWTETALRMGAVSSSFMLSRKTPLRRVVAL